MTVADGVESRSASKGRASAGYFEGFHSFHTRWGVITGPGRQAQSGCPREPEPPGEFVSEELRDDCARFLEDLRALIDRRCERAEDDGWVPTPRLDAGQRPA
jgi:hypothetical protein